jgi:hypothetical protein
MQDQCRRVAEGYTKAILNLYRKALDKAFDDKELTSRDKDLTIKTPDR